jgi:hypothetical protein
MIFISTGRYTLAAILPIAMHLCISTLSSTTCLLPSYLRGPFNPPTTMDLLPYMPVHFVFLCLFNHVYRYNGLVGSHFYHFYISSSVSPHVYFSLPYFIINPINILHKLVYILSYIILCYQSAAIYYAGLEQYWL